MKKILTLLSSICLLITINASAQCIATAFATPTPCNPATNLYDVSGTIMYVNPPTTGTLEVVGSCGGTQSFSAPFPSSVTYALVGLTSNGASCNVFCYFSDLPTCFYSAPYTAPAACGTSCVATGNVITGACNPPTNDFTLTGSFYFFGEPTTGTFNIVNSCGGSQTFTAPFTSPVNFSFPGVPANGASCTVTGGFSAIPTCMYTVMYTAPAACGTTSVDENAFLSNLSIAPNPSNGSINLSFNQSQIQTTCIDIVDVLGRTVYTENLPKFTGSYSKKLDLTSFTKGIYFVRITGEKGSETRKIIYY